MKYSVQEMKDGSVHALILGMVHMIVYMMKTVLE